jgi:tripartite-type tricarboxylate transporter receptor subunit TctC
MREAAMDKIKSIRCVLMPLLFGLTLTIPASAEVNSYPSRAVTIVVAFAPGGATDVVARAVAQRLSEAWGRPVIIENKGGASTQIGAGYVAKSTPDGYTLLATADTTFVINPHLFRKLSYDPDKDFLPISGLGKINQALVVHPSVPMQTVGDLIAAAKASPGTLNYGSFGVGSAPHLSMELLQALVGIKLNAVHYKGGGPALIDVIAGHIPMMFINVGLMVQPWEAGQLRPLAVGSDERLSRFPQIPTVAETVGGFKAAYWFGLFAPRGTPADIVAKINDDVQRIMMSPDFREKFLDPNLYAPSLGTPEQFTSEIKADAERWGKIIKDANLPIEE